MAKQKPSLPDLPDQDYLLRALVGAANAIPGFEVDITLTVHGLVITGTLVGWKEYFDATANAVRCSAQTLGYEGPANALATLYDSIGERVTDLQEDGDPSFLHLKDAHFLNAGTFPSSGGAWWRGRLGEIDGFVIGRFSSST